ncbi:hypothetical protein [Nonomuraea sp. NPDC046570]|uniref:hypothetical protein n=1 Tax=Nonomuraea sp. NPDC046570 TaxID=3155255 RepID=UPI0033E86748
MARNGFDDATRRGTAGAAVVEGLLAYAETQSRAWVRGRSARSMERAIALSRTLAANDPEEHTALLARALRTGARQLLRHRRAAEALPLAEEAVELSRGAGGAPLVVALECLSDVLNALGRRGEAADLRAEAHKIMAG